MSEIIKIKDIHKFYKNGKDSLEALKGVSFSLKQGEILAIMGSSGSGYP
jgi:putative ABC transport system ATP-binding protein